MMVAAALAASAAELGRDPGWVEAKENGSLMLLGSTKLRLAATHAATASADGR